MPGLPPIVTLNPVTVPATVQQIYDRWYIVSLFVDGNDPNNTVAITKLRKCGTDANGNTVFHPTEPERALRIENVFLEASRNQNLANALGLIVMVVADMVSDQELGELVQPHVVNAQSAASRAESAAQSAADALAAGQAAVSDNDAAALSAAKSAAAAASTQAASESSSASSHHAMAVTASNGSTLPGVVAKVSLALSAKTAAAASAASAAQSNSSTQALTV